MKIFRSFSAYAISTLISSGASFLLIPFFTRYLTKEDYGVLGLFNIVYTLLASVISLSANGLIMADYYKQERRKNGILIFNALAVNLCLCLGFGLVFWVMRGWLSIQLAMPKHIIVLLPLVAFVSIPFQFLTLILQVTKKSFHFAVISITQGLLVLGLNFYLVKYVNMGWEGKLYALLAINIIFTAISVYFLLRQYLIVPVFDKSVVRAIFLFGLPLLPHLIGYLIIDSSDRFFLKAYVGIGELGLYNAAYQIGAIINIIDNAFTLVYAPFLSENLATDTPESHERISKMGFLYVATLFTATLGLSLLSPFIFKVFLDHKFYSAYTLVPWIAFSYLFLGVYKIFAGVIYFYKKTHYFIYLSVLNLVSNVVLNILLIPKLGTLGAAMATLISFALLSLATMFTSIRVKKLPWFNFIKKRFTYDV